ncbi:MAG: hypothetical protein KHX42_04420 [Prevotella sp.]|nr:hypothetical protein [Prevotella sp.]
MSKALLIKSYTTLTTGTQGSWNDLNMASSYIQGIQTGKILEDVNADKIASLISGVPTPWARAKLFKFALGTLANPDPAITNSGLTQYYEMLHGEWRGLITLMALHSDRIRISKPVYMNAKGGDYDIASAFGRMLFNDKDIWSNQDKLAKNPDEQPYIHLIYYKEQLIGGTTPLTGVFTGVNYSNLQGATDISWYRNGKLEDPMPYLSPDQLQKLYLFVKNMNGNLDKFEDKVNSHRSNGQKVNIDGFKAMSRDWEVEIKQKANNLREKGPIPTYGTLSCPFSILFESNVPVYLKLSDYTFTYSAGDGYKTIGDIQNLLSNDEFVIGWAEDSSQRQKRSDAPVYYLQVKDLHSGSTCYFSIPLSDLGIDIYKNRLSELLNYSTGGNSHITASISDSGEVLSVTMVVEIDGESVTLNTREYKIDWLEDMGRVILWPNFVSDKWNKYYLYSEFTSDARNKFQPIFRFEGNILLDGNGAFLTPEYKPEPNEQIPVGLKPLITYPAGQGEDLPKYNIIAADKPIEGLIATVQKSGHDERAGFLMLRHNIVQDLTSVDTNSKAIVGIDFGSNNTCVYYNADDRGAKPVAFENNRAVLVGNENEDKRANAGNDELLFFTNYPAENGQLKSWLHEHDSRYNCYNQSEEVAGGVPVNRPNVVVRKMDEYEITTQAGTLHYNMKWLDNQKGLEKKRAYLKSIWLQTCAFLYKNKIRPEEISWSHPGSMMESDINDYDKIFNDLIKINPITIGRKPTINESFPTEAEAVCSFALSQDFGLAGNNMFLGIDVGGSTSDILLLAKDPTNNNKASLYRESSVRLAAGVFFDAIIKSETFRQALVNFHESNQKSVYVSNIKDVMSEATKAPYYLNNIFDQLKSTEDYDSFYETIDRDAKFAFTIPAYVTGLLLFYSGMLIGKTIKENGLNNIERVDILSFGKGGRIFHWLRNSAGNRATREYYSTCLNAGVKCVTNIELIVKYRDEIEVDNKAEVAKGLCDPKDVVKKQDTDDRDICGEIGVKYLVPGGSMKTLSVEDELTGDYFADDMGNFDFSNVTNFETFMNIFVEFVSQKTKMYPKADSELRDDLDDLPGKIAAFICNNDREYKKAKEKAKTGDGFHYHQPIIIAEGICFLNTLIRKAFNQ